MLPRKGKVIQFTENHKWAGCFGIIDEVKNDIYLIGMPMVVNDKVTTAYIRAMETDFEVIGTAVLVEDKQDE